jgi:hypothetical protein
MFSLDALSDFWDSDFAETEPHRISKARPSWRVLLFLGFVSRKKLIDGRTNQFERRASVTTNVVAFKQLGSNTWGNALLRLAAEPVV